jgi:DNA-binding MarR family transcriptional regulator
LTEDGHKALAEIIPVATAVETRLLKNLPKKDLETFFRVIEHLHDVLDQDPEARPKPPTMQNQ